MKKFYKRFVAIIVLVSLTIVCFAIPASAMDSERIIASPSASFYDIEVGGVIYDVVITRNSNGTRNICVEGNGTTLSWTTKVREVEPVPSAVNVEANSYGPYRYTFCETCATAWYLYRPLQDDGGAATKGIDDPDSEFARRFADEIKNMIRAEELISDFLEINELITVPVTEILLNAVGDISEFLVKTSKIGAVIAGAISFIIDLYDIPELLKSGISDLIEDQYYEIRSSVSVLDNYFELA